MADPIVTPAPQPEVPPPQTPPPTPPMSVSVSAQDLIDLADYDAETVRLVNAQMAKVDEAQTEYVELNEEMKAARGVRDAREDELHNLIKERAAARGKPVQRTLLDLVPDPATVPLLPGGQAERSQLADLWRRFPLDRLTIHGITDKQAQILAEGVRKDEAPHPITSMGALADYTSNPQNPGYERRLVDFKGIGMAACTSIDEALERFWGWWNGGGQSEFATEMGLNPTVADGTEDQPEAGAGGAGPGHEGDDGQPGGPGSDAQPATEPVGGPDEYSLAGDGAQVA